VFTSAKILSGLARIVTLRSTRYFDGNKNPITTNSAIRTKSARIALLRNLIVVLPVDVDWMNYGVEGTLPFARACRQDFRRE
jgi:hypothetical protein